MATFGSSIVKIGVQDFTLDPGPFRVTGVQFSGAMPGGHGSASFDVPVANAYLAPLHTLREGAWVEIYDDAHELYEGEVFSIKPTVDSSGQHKLSVTCGGLISVAGKRADVSATWVHRGSAEWFVLPYVGMDSFGEARFNEGAIELRVAAGAGAATTAPWVIAAFVLDSGLSDETISYLAGTASWDVRDDNSDVWHWYVYGHESLADAIANCPFGVLAPIGDETDTTDSDYSWSATPLAGTKCVTMNLVCTSMPNASTLSRYVILPTIEVYSRGRTTKPRLDEAMVDIATRPGLAVSYESLAVGPRQDDLHVGNGLAKTTAAAALEELAAKHAQPSDWGFWDEKKFWCKPRPRVLTNDAKVIVVGNGDPCLESWDVAEYDEDVPDAVEVLFGNKDDAGLPEGYPRSIYRPATPADDADLKVEVLDHSGLILSDGDAAALGDNIIGHVPGELPSGVVFDAFPELAKGGTLPGNNDDPTTSFQEVSESKAVGTLTDFGGIAVSGGTVTTDGDYTLHTFTTSGWSSLYVTPGASLDVEYLVVGGGGGGGDGCLNFVAGSGGGGGQVLSGSMVLTDTVPVCVGPGGLPLAGWYAGGAGGSSRFNDVVASAGQGGKYGAGGQYGDPVGGTSGSGYAGGTYNFAGRNAGGGGGASAVGASASSSAGGGGGAGTASSLSGASVQYGGGGGGGAYDTYGSTKGIGVYGGGNGGSDVVATAGTANRGGGGGGGSYEAIPGWSGAAGSAGIVIVRYLTADLAEGSSTRDSGWAGTNSPGDPTCTVDAGSGYIDFGDLSQCDFNAVDFSVSAWFKVDALGTFHTLASKRLGTTTYQGWLLGVTAEGYVFGAVYEDYAADTYRAAAATAAIEAGRWYHLVMDYVSGNFGDVYLLLDGVSVATTTAGTPADYDVRSSADLLLRSDTSVGYLSGSLARVTVWSRSLTQEEVEDVFAAGTVYYDRSLSKGTAVLRGTCRNRKGALVPAHHVRAGWFIQNLDWQPDPSKPPPALFVTGHSVDLAGKKNALTIGIDWMEKEIGVRAAELLAWPATVVPDAVTEDYNDPYTPDAPYEPDAGGEEPYVDPAPEPEPEPIGEADPDNPWTEPNEPYIIPPYVPQPGDKDYGISGPFRHD